MQGLGFFSRVAAGAPYVAALWNLNDLPGAAGAHGSMLRHPGDDVPGVTTRALGTGTNPGNQGPGFFCKNKLDHLDLMLKLAMWVST